jgi:predicted MFS family arabinose efflux permease
MFVVAVLWTAFFVVNFNIAMMIPLLPFIQQDMGLSPTQAGMVLAAFPVVALISNLALGPLIDRFGRKRFIVTGAAGCAAILLLTAAARNSIPIALGRAATGLFMPMIGASVYAAIADYVPAPHRARVAGYVTSAAPIAFLCSMSLGTFLGGLFAWQLPLILLAAVATVLAASASRLPATRPEALSDAPISARTYRQRLLSLSMDASTRLLFAAYFLWAAAVFIFLGLYPSWLVQHGLAAQGTVAIGTMLLVGEIGGLFGALFSGRLIGMFRHPFGLGVFVVAGTAAVVLLIPAGTGLIAFQAIGYALFAFGRDLTLALMLGSAMLLVAAAQRGSLNAILNAVYQTGATVGGIASAWLYGARADFVANAVVASALLAASALLLWRLTKLKQPDGGGHAHAA